MSLTMYICGCMYIYVCLCVCTDTPFCAGGVLSTYLSRDQDVFDQCHVSFHLSSLNII